jgi:alanine racemase
MINSNAIVEINKKNLLYNYQLFKKIAKKSIVAATIKANAYGLGYREIFTILFKEGCRHFFLATTEEGIDVRKLNKKVNIYVLNGLEGNELKIFSENNLIPILNSKEELYILNKNVNLKKIKFGMHIETGLNRLGINLKKIEKNLIKEIKLEILLSHLASPDELNNKYNDKQNLIFKKYISYFRESKYKSLASSAGIMNNVNLHHNMVRPGIGIYGGCDNITLKKKFKIKPVINIKGKILQIKKIDKNQYVGYNQTYLSNKIIKIAIVGIGYADGISRLISNNGKLYFKEDSYKIIGRISMDSITVDITNSKYKIKTGQYMELINHSFTIEKMAKKCGTISNEILTSISKRVKRVYI